MTSPWMMYQPNDNAPWNLRRVHHLHRRAGFGANWETLQRDLQSGPDAAIDRLVDVAELVKSFDVEGGSKVLTTSATDVEGGSKVLTTSATDVEGESKVLTTSATEVEGGSKVLTTSATDVEGETKVLATSATEVEGGSKVLTTSATDVEGGSKVLTTSATEVEGGSKVLTTSATEVEGESKVLTTSATDFESLQRLIGDAAVSSGDINRLKAWWFYRILYSDDPLTERLTLMWHNHFATSNLKVKNARMMKRQNDLIRQHAMGKFGDLLRAVVKDAAMVVWLDAKANRKSNPNENLARELMELFTLGVGHYNENDVKEVARALTGWTTRNDVFANVDAYHDDGAKQLLGRQGNFDGDDVLAILLDQDAVAKRIAFRLCEAFFGENVINDESMDELAKGLREHDLDVGWAVKTILRSRLFFDESNLGNRVLDPIQFMVGPLRSLQMLDPPPSTLLLAEWSAKLGQDLFYPPNVFGWPGGRSWLTTRTMIARANYTSALCGGDLHRPVQPLAIEALAQQYGYSSEPTETNFASELLFGRNGQAGTVETMLRSTAAHLG